MKTALQIKREQERKAALQKFIEESFFKKIDKYNTELNFFDGYYEYVQSAAALKYDENTDQAIGKISRYKKRYH